MFQETLPGLFVWSAFHEGIEARVYSAYFAAAGTLIDPMLPEDDGDPLQGLPAPQRIVLTNRHHYRHSGKLSERFACPVLCHQDGLHEFRDERDVSGYAFGEEIAPGVSALELSSIAPEEATLALDSGPGVLAFGDGLRRGDDGSLQFMRDTLLGKDPEAVKAGLRRQLREMFERDFDAMIFAHGEPLPQGARAKLKDFLSR